MSDQERIAELETLVSGYQADAYKRLHSSYGFGIVDRVGKPVCEGFMHCCSRRYWMDSQVSLLNQNNLDPRTPYRVVQLSFQSDGEVNGR